MWIYDYKTKKEYFASSPRSKFYCYQSMEIEPIPGKPCTILIKKGTEEGRKPAQTFDQLYMFPNQSNPLDTSLKKEQI